MKCCCDKLAMTMRFGKTLAFGAMGIVLSFAGVVEAAPQCLQYFSKIRGANVNYCVHRSRPDLPAVSGEPVIYFFHGITGNAKSYTENGYSEALDILAPEENFPSFTIVSFDTSGRSFFSDRNDVKTGPQAFETWFITEFMSFIENKYDLCNQKKCRGLAGLSMGGYGALKTGLKYKERFSFVGINSAAIAPFNIWNNLVDWNAYFSRNPIGPWQGHALLQDIRGIFRNKEMYQRNDPVQLLLNIKDEADAPKIYIDVGGKDYFGFQEGFFTFTKILDDRRWSYESFYVPDGGHDIFHDRRWWLMRFIRDQVLSSTP